MQTERIQGPSRGERTVTRAGIVGVLLGLFGFVYFPLWVAAVFLALGAVLGLAATVLESAVADAQR